jgi:endoglucanase
MSMIVSAGLFFAAQRTAHATEQPRVVPLNPADGAYASGRISLTSKVEGLEPAAYEMFWAVGNGEWNRMSVNTSTKIAQADIDIAGWNWKSDNLYTLRFIALLKDGWRPIESSVTIKKGSAPVTAIQPVIPPVSVPVETAKLFADPQSALAKKAANDPNNASLNYIASQPLAHWFGEWNQGVTRDVDEYVSRARAAGATPTVVLYNIPNRDCGSYSAGGVSHADEYASWISRVADGLNQRSAIVIVEPDALAGMDCLSSTDKTARTSMIAKAVTTLKKGDTKVYLDAGHAAWHGSDTIASRLKSANVSSADGFALNVSNFRTTPDSISYGKTISSKVGDKRFVIDTSRNGNGPATSGEWCNPSGRALGAKPTLATGDEKVDALLWIKTPGDSDGACGNGAPAAGQWWQSYADMLYTNRVR